MTLLACPGCGAPLQNVKDADGLITCTFCSATCRISTTSHAAAGHKNTPVKTWWLYFDSPSKERNKLLNEARQKAARARKQRKKAEQRAKSKGEDRAEPKRKDRQPNWWVGLLPLAVLLSGIPLYFVIMKPWEVPEEEQLPSDEVLAGFSFAAPSADIASKLKVEDGPRLSAKLDPKGVFSEVSINWGDTPRRSMSLTGGEAFDGGAAEQRLEELFPGSTAPGNRNEVSANLLLLRLTAVGQARIEIMTWIKDDAKANDAADAAWTAARYLAYGGDRPPEEVLRRLRGPSLPEIGELDVTVPVGKAIETVQASIPEAACNTVTDMMANTTELRCTVDVAHPLIDKVTLAWPNEPEATIAHAILQYESGEGISLSETVTRCLDSSLGKGDKEVTDHATGDGFMTYPLGESGDRVEVHPYVLNIKGPDEGPAAWAAHLGKLMKAIDGCRS